MMEKMEFDPGRDEGVGDPEDREAMRRLDDVTEEPAAAVERAGDFREAEAIQGEFVSAVIGGGKVPGATPLPIPRPADAAEPGKPPEDAVEVQVDGKRGRPSPTFTLDGQGAVPSPGIAGEAALAAPRETQSGGAPGQAGSSAPGMEAKNAVDEEDLRQMAQAQKDKKSPATQSNIQQGKHPSGKEAIKNIR
ncbi:MAG: hypothetical protein JW929_04080 [Anaerolineales bacterium]|nr:hypothetical protein [Anaerolineales bacterium]